jgi:hypothetical protein
MAVNIDVSFVNQYKDAVYMNAEINGGKFSGKIREESITGEAAFYETLDSVFAEAAGAQFADSPIGDIVHGRRQVVPVDLEVGLMLDNWDKVKTLASFEGRYVKRMVEALMRKKDIATLTGALGTAQTGKAGATATPFAFASQSIPISTGGTGQVGLNVAKLKAAKALFWANGVNIEDPDKKLYMVCSGKQIEDLLNDDEAINSDYASVKALVNGDINQFMGFEIIRSELVPYVSAITTDLPTAVELDWTATDVPKDTSVTEVRACFAYAKDSVLCATNPDITSKVAERSDKRFNWYAYSALGVGAVRMEEKGVVLIGCDETPAV